MADSVDLFKTAPAEIVRYFRAKKSQPSFDWRDVAPQEHAFSFTVAKTTERDVLEDIRAAVDDAVVNRVPFAEFQKRLTPILQDKGWWGKAVMGDPKDGVPKVVRLGSPRRLRIIYWANTRTAHAAGEWERTQRTKNFLPYLIYTLSTAENKRPEHQSWVGTVLPVDHPWWTTHYPPNGWLCKCGVRQIARGEAERNGYVENAPAPPVNLQPWRNARTGETMQVPKGIDPGWQGNPGARRAANVSTFLHDKVADLPPNRQRVAIEDIVGSPILKAMAEKRMPKDFAVPVAQAPQPVVEALKAKTALVSLGEHSAGHIIAGDPTRNLDVDDLRQAIEVIVRPEVAAWGKEAIILLGRIEGKWWRVVVKPASEGLELWVKSFHRKSAGDAEAFIKSAKRRGALIELEKL